MIAGCRVVVLDTGNATDGKGFQSRKWLFTYKTSSTMIDGRPVDILHDFYIPALELAISYDRVAGYFRSSSLAAASQGFSAFVGRKGKMRLIVGADLDPEDVKAILSGDAQRFAIKLNKELDDQETWPEGVRNGVTLLAWMVAHGYLEVRVAFRVHKITGEPLSLDAIDDGYVHEKWFIMRDEYGNRILGSGTLNESKTALVLNAENLDIHCDWWGEMEALRVEQAERDFENLWAGRVAHMPVLTLPEAVRRKLIKIAEGIEYPMEVDGSTAVSKAVKFPSAMERLKFAIIRDAPKMPGGRFVGVETAPVSPWPHQAVVVRRLIETWPYSYLLCDEVGLGKTIEAGLAFRSLYLSGLVKRILIAAPAGLTRQWHRQMASKMLLSFGLVNTTPQLNHEYIFPTNENRPASSLYEPPLIIMSTGLLARQERAKALAGAEPFDIVFIDEAHALRRKNPSAGLDVNPEYGLLYKSVRDHLRPKARSLWLATATPMQIHPVEVCDLLALTNRVGAFQFDPTLTLQYYEILDKLLRNRELDQFEWKFLRNCVKVVEMQDPKLWDFLQNNVIDGRIRIAVKLFLENELIPKGMDRQLMIKLFFSVAPLSRVMMRHTRQLLEIYREKGQLKQNLARRNICPMPVITFNELERKVYEQLEEYCNGLSNQIKGSDTRTKNMVNFLLNFMRLRFASSLYAIQQTLKRRLEKVEDTLKYKQLMDVQKIDEEELTEEDMEEIILEYENEDDIEIIQTVLKNRKIQDLEWERDQLKKMLSDMADISGPSSKMIALLKELEKRRDPKDTGRFKQTVIFTRFYDTLTDIVRRLRQVEPQMLIGTYSGREAQYYDRQKAKMISVDREEVKTKFLRGEIDILICTDAAAEGLNLQTADMLINFDLGWNPMKIEQRIGRIDRIGQKHEDIYILNLCYADSVEQIVYDRLLSRLAKAAGIVGAQQMSLLPIKPKDFEELAQKKLSFEELEKRVQQRIEEQRRRTQTMEISPRDLYDIYMKSAEASDCWPSPIKLADIWNTLSDSKYLQDLGCEISQEKILVFNVKDVPDGTILTASRELYEEGCIEDTSRVHFASYGDPYFEAILNHVKQFELPACIRRIAVPVEGMDGVEVIGYAVACKGINNMVEVRLVTAWKDIENIELAENYSLSEEEIEPLRKRLKSMAINELRHYLALERIERNNVKAARAQEVLNLLVIQKLLDSRARFVEGQALFSQVLREVRELFQEREYINLAGLSADVLREIKDDLLFECQIPTLGDRASIPVPRILGLSSISSAQRIAYSTKFSKRKLLASTVIERLKREVNSKLELYRGIGNYLMEGYY